MEVENRVERTGIDGRLFMDLNLGYIKISYNHNMKLNLKKTTLNNI